LQTCFTVFAIGSVYQLALKVPGTAHAEFLRRTGSLDLLDDSSFNNGATSQKAEEELAHSQQADAQKEPPSALQDSWSPIRKEGEVFHDLAGQGA
jgi:hypothetical protein